MFLIIHEHGEYADYSSKTVGYVTEESRAKEIVTKKNEEFKQIEEIKNNFDEFSKNYDQTPIVDIKFKNTNLWSEEEKICYNNWSNKRNADFENWWKEQHLTPEMEEEVIYFYSDKYKYQKIKEL